MLYSQSSPGSRKHEMISCELKFVVEAHDEAYVRIENPEYDEEQGKTYAILTLLEQEDEVSLPLRDVTFKR